MHVQALSAQHHVLGHPIGCGGFSILAKRPIPTQSPSAAPQFGTLYRPLDVLHAMYCCQPANGVVKLLQYSGTWRVWSRGIRMWTVWQCKTNFKAHTLTSPVHCRILRRLARLKSSDRSAAVALATHDNANTGGSDSLCQVQAQSVGRSSQLTWSERKKSYVALFEEV